MVGSSIVEARAVLIPFQRKMHSSAQQWGQNGEPFNCRRPPAGGGWCEPCRVGDGVKIGATMILTSLLGGLVA